MGKRLWDLAKSRIEIGTILPGHRHKVRQRRRAGAHRPRDQKRSAIIMNKAVSGKVVLECCERGRASLKVAYAGGRPTRRFSQPSRPGTAAASIGALWSAVINLTQSQTHTQPPRVGELVCSKKRTQRAG